MSSADRTGTAAWTKLEAAGYGPERVARLPEFAGLDRATPALLALRRLLVDGGFDARRAGSAEWNPLGEVIAPGSRVLVKPNWVLHHNRSGGGMDCLVTHWTVIEAVVLYAALARPDAIALGDAPIGRCDFGELRRTAGIDMLLERLARRGIRVEARDFRRARLNPEDPHAPAEQECAPERDFVLFDLGEQSALEPVSGARRRFRVTMYDPRRMWCTHGPGRHQYLVSRAAIEADVILNLAKLKTHRKAGLTGAIKNLIGINGHKEYLPHHRTGSARLGGDCYEQPSCAKSLAEVLHDAANLSRQRLTRRLLRGGASALVEFGRLGGGDGNLDGAWSGNDTVWRTALDIQHIARYGRPDGSLADRPQRQMVNVVDAIVAGGGEGPLEPAPVPLGLLGLSLCAASADWAGALLMGIDPRRVAITREAFADAPFALTDCAPEDVRAQVDGEPLAQRELVRRFGQRAELPERWRGRCELGIDSNDR